MRRGVEAKSSREARTLLVYRLLCGWGGRCPILLCHHGLRAASPRGVERVSRVEVPQVLSRELDVNLRVRSRVEHWCGSVERASLRRQRALQRHGGRVCEGTKRKSGRPSARGGRRPISTRPGQRESRQGLAASSTTRPATTQLQRIAAASCTSGDRRQQPAGSRGRCGYVGRPRRQSVRIVRINASTWP